MGTGQRVWKGASHTFQMVGTPSCAQQMFCYPTLCQDLVLYSLILTTPQSVRFGGLLMHLVSPGISIEPHRKEDYSEYLLKKYKN